MSNFKSDTTPSPISIFLTPSNHKKMSDTLLFSSLYYWISYLYIVNLEFEPSCSGEEKLIFENIKI